jgi:gamma-glutamyltranspeptidase/glutathione hydrolase
LSLNAVATPHTLSTSAAIRILDDGGNAVDAAIAAIAAQGVVAPETCGVGGDLFALVHRKGWDRPRALNASGRAGSKASVDRVPGRDHVNVPRDHPMAVTIPGCVDGLFELSNELGSIGFDDVLAPAIELARDGFEASYELARAFKLLRDVYGDNPAVADMYPNGRPVAQGETIRRPALAETLERVAIEGRDGFYMGRAGEDIIASTQGIISADDLARHQAEWIDAIGVEVEGQVAWTIPPNSQGYLGPGALAVFEMLDPPTDPADPLWWHLLIESYRCLAWERDDIVADPEHAPLPADLMMDRERLERAASTVSREQAGIWPDRIGSLTGTAYLCVADSNGMAVSMIQSNYHGTGSPFGANRSGFLLQDRGAGFSLTRGHPNEVAPGKRPHHTLSPTLWTSGAETSWLLGTRGGAVQPQLVAQVAARAILGTHDLETALAAPRWTVSEVGPGSVPALRVEPGIPAEVLEDLRGRGHTVDVLDDRQPGWGPVSIIEMSDGARHAAADPRVATSNAQVW